MAGGLVRPIVIRKQATAARLETAWKDVGVEEGSPWAIRLVSSCYLADTTRNDSPTPKVELSVSMSCKHVDAIGQLDFDLTNPGWEDVLDDAASTCVNYLTRRHVPVPDEFREYLLSCLKEARITAILYVVRYQAASLIHHIPSIEACRIWSEEEIKHIFES
jgi:hypothetical protein